MKHRIDIINGINKIFIEMRKDDLSDLETTNKTDKYKNLLKKLVDVYRCVKTLTIDNVLIDKTRNHIKNTMILWKELKIPVTPSAHLLEDYLLKQMITIKGGIADKTEDHIERRYQVGKCFDQRNKCVTNFTQSQTLQIKLQGLLSNPIIKMKLEEIKIESSRKLKRKR